MNPGRSAKRDPFCNHFEKQPEGIRGNILFKTMVESAEKKISKNSTLTRFASQMQKYGGSSYRSWMEGHFTVARY